MLGKWIIRICSFLPVLLLLQLSASTVEASSLRFDTTTKTATAASAFTLDVVVDAGSEQVTAVDAYILYDRNIFTPGTMTPGTFLGSVSSDTQTAGVLKVWGFVESGGQAKTGSGTLATVSFTPLYAGSYTLRFDCTDGMTTDSNIVRNDANSTDTIVCAQNIATTVTVSTGPTPPVFPTASPTPSPTVVPSTPTPTPTVIAIQTPTPLPQNANLPVGGPVPVTGAADSLYLLAGLSLLFIVIGLKIGVS